MRLRKWLVVGGWWLAITTPAVAQRNTAFRQFVEAGLDCYRVKNYACCYEAFTKAQAEDQTNATVKAWRTFCGEKSRPATLSVLPRPKTPGPATPAFEPVDYAVDGLVCVRDPKTNKYGFATETDFRLAIKCQYDEAAEFMNGFARVKTGQQYGLIDRQGKAILPAHFEQIGAYSPQWAIVQRGDLWGVMQLPAGTELVPCRYETVRLAGAGRLWVQEPGAATGQVLLLATGAAEK